MTEEEKQAKETLKQILRKSIYIDTNPSNSLMNGYDAIMITLNYIEKLEEKIKKYESIKIDEKNKIQSPSFTKEQLDLMNLGIALYTNFDKLLKDDKGEEV